MHSKGQIFSADFILSVAVAVMALSVVLQLNELNFYEINEAERFARLESIGRTASDLMTQHPDFVCLIVSPGGDLLEVDYLPNTWCGNAIDGSGPEKSDLGIPDDYKCNITETSVGYSLPPGFCDDTFDIDEEKNVYTSSRKVSFIAATQIDALELQKCIDKDPACVFELVTVTLRVWWDPL